MNVACIEFQGLLERSLECSLEGRADLVQLGWHEHLLGCTACRELLAAEEALDELLATLPEPKLPERLARRVVRRLRATTSAARLDELLDLDSADAVPEGLATRVLAGLAARADDTRLDRLLDEAHAVEVPIGLEKRVLRGIADRRVTSAPARPKPLRLRLVRSPLVRAAAALLLVTGGAFATWRFTHRAVDPTDGTDGGEVAVVQPAGANLAADEGLLDALAVLENWDLIESIDPVALDAVTVFDPEDEILLELSEDG
ncbi:MAG: hypothetical protein GY711_07380 [bacterium]|nr:hypothetical protein [bacterium]